MSTNRPTRRRLRAILRSHASPNRCANTIATGDEHALIGGYCASDACELAAEVMVITRAITRAERASARLERRLAALQQAAIAACKYADLTGMQKRSVFNRLRRAVQASQHV